MVGDANLVTGNIKSGITLFGVNGKTEVVDTTEATSPATATTLLSGKKAFVNGVAVTGTVPAGANVTGTAGNLVMTIPNGLYLGSETATANDADLIASNIKNGIDLFGVLGTYNPLIATGNATVAQVLSGQTFSNSSSSGLTGTMPNLGAVTITPSTTPQTIAAGYHDGSGTVVGDADLTVANIKSGINLFGVVGTLIGVGGNVQDTTTGDAVVVDILVGKKAWVDGVEITGTVPAGANVTGTAGNLDMTIPDGLYSGSKTATANDAAATNVKSGINIFGVTGDLNVVNTSTGDATAADIASGKKAWVEGSEITGTASGGSTYNAAVPRTGQTICYDASGTVIICAGTGQDGALQKGVALPSPRFTDNSNGTVTDNLTGLIWLKNANCANAAEIWANAWTYVASLNSVGTMNGNNCGDTSNSGNHQVDWRLPNVRELQSLIHYGYWNPALSNAAGTAKWTAGDAFLNVVNGYYWSASSYAVNTAGAWNVSLNVGGVSTSAKSYSYSVWPVRGGQ
ncbi:MAG: hypothetical protein BWK78_04255 [Thiotrichaceae bacterium IS1]|nr:MAG: hypothetical protein BWK78_04255 [Thiotrichaceae bacterium IS1]